MLERALYLTVSILVAVLFVAPSVHADAMSPIKIEPVNVQPTGGGTFNAGFQWETGRTLSEGNPDRDYDNIRLHPLSFEYGFSDNLQFGAGLGYSSNSADNSSNQPDEGGFEGLTLSSRYQWNQNVATSLELGFLGGDDVFPYSNDGFNLSLNVPMQVQMGPGSLFGELGYSLQTGDATLGGTTGDREGYLNYGIGYVYEVNRSFGLSGELRGHGETVENGESMLDLVLGVPFRMSETHHLKPSLTMGLSDGSPDFALGVNWGMKFGNQERYADQSSGQSMGTNNQAGGMDQASTNQNQQQDNPLVVPDEQQSQSGQQDTSGSEESDDSGDDRLLEPQGPESSEQSDDQDQETGPTYNPEQAAQQAEQARRAFEEGNIERAIELYTQAAENDPTNVEYQSNLGSLHYREQNYDQAREHYQQAVEIDPRDYFSHLYLGATHYQLGNEGQAEQHFNRVLEIDPGNEEAQQWLDRLE